MNNLAGAWSPSGLGVVHLHTAPSQCDPAPMRPLPGTINCAIVWHRYLCFIRNAVVLCSVWASLHASLAVWDSQAASVHTHTHPHTHTHTHTHAGLHCVRRATAQNTPEQQLCWQRAAARAGACSACRGLYRAHSM